MSAQARTPHVSPATHTPHQPKDTPSLTAAPPMFHMRAQRKAILVPTPGCLGRGRVGGVGAAYKVCDVDLVHAHHLSLEVDQLSLRWHVHHLTRRELRQNPTLARLKGSRFGVGLGIWGFKGSLVAVRGDSKDGNGGTQRKHLQYPYRLQPEHVVVCIELPAQHAGRVPTSHGAENVMLAPFWDQHTHVSRESAQRWHWVRHRWHTRTSGSRMSSESHTLTAAFVESMTGHG
eukprot:2805800-Rhodomonas_salina.2